MLKYSINDRKYDTITIGNRTVCRFIFNNKPMTIGEIARKLKVTEACIRYRIGMGYAVDAKCRKGSIAKVHTIDGRRLTAKDISNMFGMNIGKVYNIMKVCRVLHDKVTLDMFRMF